MTPDTYSALIANAHAYKKTRAKKGFKLDKNKRLRLYVEGLIEYFWTPEAIAGRLKSLLKRCVISHESIYMWIYGQARHLIKYLPRFHQKRKKRRSSTDCRGRIRKQTSIKQRPIEAETRANIGHIEADTIVCRQSKHCICTSIDRKTRFVQLRKLNSCTAQKMHNALVSSWKLFSVLDLIKTITYDNGKENAYHERTNKKLKCLSFFTHPYSSWEKGSVEQVNGLVRRFIPKKTDLSLIFQSHFNIITELLDNRHRNCLGRKHLWK